MKQPAVRPLDIASGSVIAQRYRRHRHQELLRFLKAHRRRHLPQRPDRVIAERDARVRREQWIGQCAHSLRAA